MQGSFPGASRFDLLPRELLHKRVPSSCLDWKRLILLLPYGASIPIVKDFVAMRVCHVLVRMRHVVTMVTRMYIHLIDFSLDENILLCRRLVERDSVASIVVVTVVIAEAVGTVLKERVTLLLFVCGKSLRVLWMRVLITRIR